jgi:hypothetical protein
MKLFYPGLSHINFGHPALSEKYLITHNHGKHDYLRPKKLTEYTDYEQGNLLYKRRIFADHIGERASSLFHGLAERELELAIKYPDADLLCCMDCSLHYVEEEKTQYQNASNYVSASLDKLCPMCIDRVFQPCDDCHDYFPRLHVRGLRGRTYEEAHYFCDECFQKNVVLCPHCKAWALKQDMIDVPEIGKTLCYRCVQGIHRTCTKCGDPYTHLYRRDHWDNPERDYCDACLMKEPVYHSHKFKPNSVQFRHAKREQVDNNTLYLGFEWEVEIDPDYNSQRDIAYKFKKRFGTDYFYMVHDGSMRHGIEIVHMPVTPMFLRENRKHFEDMYNWLIAHKCYFNMPKVGLHIHTSLAAWKRSSIYKLINFLYGTTRTRNSGRINLYKIWGRRPNRYCAFRGSELNNSLSVAKDKKNAHDEQHIGHDAHYHAINMESGKTLEFRMFAGAEDYETLLMRIDFVYSMMEFTDSYGYKDMNTKKYLEFLDKHPSIYHRIIKALSERMV